MKQWIVKHLRILITRLTLLSNRLDPLPQDVMDAAWTLEEYLRTQPSVLPDRIVSALMEIGMPCDWVEDDTQ
jgi:hypothetical protein